MVPKRKRGEKADHAEARARVRARVREIAQLMSRLEWRPHMAADLAPSWGVAEGTVQKYAAEASRMVEDAAADSDGALFRAGLVECVLETVSAARAKNDFRAALVGYRLLADFGGHLAPSRSKVEMTGADGGALKVAAVVEVVELPPLKPV